MSGRDVLAKINAAVEHAARHEPDHIEPRLALRSVRQIGIAREALHRLHRDAARVQLVMHRVRALQCENETIEPDRKTDEVRPRAGAGAQEFEIVGAEDKELIDRSEAVRRPRRRLKPSAR